MATIFRKAIDLSRIQPTSKLSLKLSCLEACANDVKAASELYEFVAGDLDLPDVEPTKPSTLEQVKANADDIFAWIGSHKEDLLQGYQLIKGIAARPRPSAEIPPIPKI